MIGPVRFPKLPPTIDIVFRMLFDQRDGCRLLISFLNAILKLEGAARIVDLSIVPRQMTGTGVEDKEVVLDVRARTLSGRQFNIEVQIRFYDAYAERVLYYWSNMYCSQLDVGDDYDKLQPAYSISLLQFPLLPDEPHFADYHHEYELMCRKTGHCLTRHISVHMVELKKFQKALADLADEEQKWIYFIRHGHEMTAEQASQLGVPEIVEAERRLDMISQDRILRIQTEQREKARRDAISHYLGKEQVLYAEQLRSEGRKEAMMEAIHDMCDLLGISPTPEQLDYLVRLDNLQLEALRQHIKTHRAWPAPEKG